MALVDHAHGAHRTGHSHRTLIAYGERVIPIVTPAEMAAIDARADVSTEVLIQRAGAAVARAALAFLGGTYGRRVTVIVGKGNNGNDGRAAARRLERKGVRVAVLDATTLPERLPPADLVIDAAYGTGFRGSWPAPDAGDTPVIAVDIPSGIDGLTGAVGGPVMRATATVTFAALKPGLVLVPGRELVGTVEVADIGLDVSRARSHLVEDTDVATWVPARRPDAHKWRAAVWVVAGSTGMTGAAHLAARGAQRAGAGMVRLGTPAVGHDPMTPVEVVGRPLPPAPWHLDVLADLERFHALVVGPGLGRADTTAESVRALVAAAPVPAVVDGDGLVALAWSSEGPAKILEGREAPTVLTPHDGEFAFLRGARVGADRLASARKLSADLRAVVLLKGPTTVVAAPDGRVLVIAEGDSRLATAGTGDVLAGVIGALLAQRVAPLEAAGAGAWLHARAALHGYDRGLVAGDLPDLLPEAFADIAR
jgi:hydroxyethylthiazole kinase-like uncharacterized protein yjeF